MPLHLPRPLPLPNNAMTNDTSPSPQKRTRTLLALTAFFIAAGVAYAIYYVLVLSTRLETDNAYVGGNLVVLSSQVPGTVVSINADETQMVRAGAELVKLDAADAELALAQAEARLGSVVRQLRERYTNVGQFDAAIAERTIALQAARQDLTRRLPLAEGNTLSGEEIAHARQAVDNAAAALEVARKQAGTAHAGIAGVNPSRHPLVDAARAEYMQAWLATRRNNIVAPVSGYVARRSVQLGARINPGAPLLTIVPLDQLWVDANFKESELRDVRVGQDATVEADIYGNKVRYHGKVMGLSAGTGSAFSLLPAQNASGNWIKVVQRLPVRISLDPRELAAHPLRVGLSTEVTLDIAQKGGAPLAPSAAAPASAAAVLAQPLEQARIAADVIVARNLAP
jgi:membrane fusion protein (multidrug efflux system)